MVVPAAVDVGVAEQFAVESQFLDEQVGEDGLAFFQVVQLGIAADEAVEVEVHAFEQEVERGEVKLVEGDGEGVFFLHGDHAVDKEALFT